MNTAHDTAGSRMTITAAWRIPRLVEITFGAFHEWRRRGASRGELYRLDDRELRDIGITRGEIGYIASNSPVDPRADRAWPFP